MEEDAYRQAYREANPRRCVFEKCILARHCACSQALRLNLAEREAVACRSEEGLRRCEQWLDVLRHKALFALHLREIEGPLPHAKEIKVQAGGLLGLSRVTAGVAEGDVTDVDGLLAAACEQYGEMTRFPFADIVQAITHFVARPRRKPRQ